jgi:molybdate transport system substrate-binding protein
LITTWTERGFEERKGDEEDEEDEEDEGDEGVSFRKKVFVFLFCLFFLQSCLPLKNDEGVEEIIVVASSSLSKAFDELTKIYTTKNRAVVITSYDATTNIAKQIENGAPFDVFASADTEAIVKLRKEGLIVTESEKIFARGSLILWSPSLQIKSIEDLTNQNITRIALANPEIAPYGRAAVETLKQKNLYEQVKDKIIYGQNVTQVKQYAETENVDVGFVPLSLVKDEQGTKIEIDEKLHQPLENSIVILKDSKQQKAAQRFLDFVLSEEGKAILKKYGYK